MNACLTVRKETRPAPVSSLATNDYVMSNSARTMYIIMSMPFACLRTLERYCHWVFSYVDIEVSYQRQCGVWFEEIDLRMLFIFQY